MLTGIEKVFRGIIKYRKTNRNTMVEQFKRVRDDPNPTAVFITCVDSRILPTRFTETNVGDMLIVRNAGNMVPHFALYSPASATTEPAALELGIVRNNIKHVVVCGHSDCKAMNELHILRNDQTPIQARGPLHAWLARYGEASIKRLEELEKDGFRSPLVFEGELPNKKFIAYIDLENKLCVEDKLSQINCLQQLQNVASHPCLKEKLQSGMLHLHAMWFDVYTGDIFYFSRMQKGFVEVKEETVDALIEEAEIQVQQQPQRGAGDS